MPRKKRPVIIVANRLPVQRMRRTDPTERWEESPGGLTTALKPVLERHGGKWVGWSGSAGPAPQPFAFDGMDLRPIALTAGEVETYYQGFSNRTLWPLYHDAIRTPEFRREWWEPYVAVNKRFAKRVATIAKREHRVWIHDYHLQLVPGLLRKLRPDLRIGFFLHIPFPPEELFAWLPWRREILEGLLGADVVGFQTHGSAQNFSRLARAYTDAEGIDTLLTFNGRDVRVGSFPISIDFKWFESVAEAPETVRQAKQIRARVGRRRVLLAVDRLDYTKGIELRLTAFNQLLRNGGTRADECVLIQIAVPSRETVPNYAETRDSVERLVARINGQFSDPGRVVVHYFRRSLPREELVPFYVAADVLLVTPLRDGMNLVAKEFVACRSHYTGVLVLSEFAGAARELRRALLVNPRDVDAMARTIQSAMSLPVDDARQRMTALRMNVRRHDVHDWARLFLEAIER